MDPSVLMKNLLSSYDRWHQEFFSRTGAAFFGSQLKNTIPESPWKNSVCEQQDAVLTEIILTLSILTASEKLPTHGVSMLKILSLMFAALIHFSFAWNDVSDVYNTPYPDPFHKKSVNSPGLTCAHHSHHLP